jgi:HlyD family secretion protein
MASNLLNETSLEIGPDARRGWEPTINRQRRRAWMRQKRAWLIAGAAILLAVAVWEAFHWGPEATPVQIALVGRQDLQAKVTANGKVQAQRKVDISATVAGQVTHLAVREGDAVKRGQFLLQLDLVNPRAAARSSEASMQALLKDLDSARASQEQARTDLRRARENHHARIISDADLDRAQTAFATSEATVQSAERRVEQARATLEGARDTLAKTTVVAPMDGVVTAKRVEEGEVAVVGVLNQPGTVLLTISDMSVVETEMEVDETSIPSVRLGQEARVRVDAYPNQTFTGLVTEVGSSPIVKTNPQTEAIKFKVKIQIKDPPADIKPGLSVQADILTAFRAQALVVPIQALVVRDLERRPGEVVPPGAPRDEEGVYLLESGRARFRPIKTGLLGELSLEVLDGLKGGETLITGPFKALRALKPEDPVKQEKPKKAEEHRPS